MFPRVAPSFTKAPSLASLTSNDVHYRERIETPTAFERVRGAGYGLLTPFRHLIEIVAVGAVSAVVGAPEPVALMIAGAAAGGSAIVGMLSEAWSPTRAVTQRLVPHPQSISTHQEVFFGPVAPPEPPRAELLERIAQSEATRAAAYLGVGCSVSACALGALGWPVELGPVLAGGFPLGLAGLVITRKVAERRATSPAT